MKKPEPVKVIVLVMLLITAAVAAFYLTTRTPASEGTLRVEYGDQAVELPLEQLDLISVQGIVRNGKGEERAIEAKGLLLSNALQAAGVESFSSVTVTADDEYSAQVTAEEVADPGKVYLIEQEEGGLQLIVFGDENSKRNVSDVVRLSVQ